MAIMFYHADNTGKDIGVIQEILKADIELQCRVGASIVDNSFSITMPEHTWKAAPIELGHRIYAGASEWGGIVTKISHSTEEASVTVAGPTWRGLLSSQYVVGARGGIIAYAGVDAADAVRYAVSAVPGSALFTVVSGSAGVNVDVSWNCVTLADALNNAFMASNCKLGVAYDSTTGKVLLSAAAAHDWSETIEISQDYGVHFTSTVGTIEDINHCIAVGGDTPGSRTVTNVYRISDEEYSTSKPAGWDDAATRSIIVDKYSNEASSIILEEAVKALIAARPTPGSIKIDSIELGVEDSISLGDYVGVRDRLTGLTAKPRVVKKILTMTGSETTIKIEVE